MSLALCGTIAVTVSGGPRAAFAGVDAAVAARFGVFAGGLGSGSESESAAILKNNGLVPAAQRVHRGLTSNSQTEATEQQLKVGA